VSEPPAVTIGLREIYDAMVELKSSVDTMVSTTAAMAARQSDHEARIRAVERRQWPLPTLAAAIGVAALILPIITGR